MIDMDKQTKDQIKTLEAQKKAIKSPAIQKSIDEKIKGLTKGVKK